MSFARLTIALSLSIALIGGALWYRLVRIPPYTADLTATQNNIEQFSNDEVTLGDYFGTSTSTPVTPNTSTTTLTQAEIVSRQLFSDFIELKSQGKNTPNNISALAQHYAGNITNTELSIPKISAERIITLPDTIENLTMYGQVMANIRSKYKNLASTEFKNLENNTLNTINSTDIEQAIAFMNIAGNIFKASIDELVLVGVPAILAENHLNLINQYIENVETMKLISNNEKDPIQAMSALNLFSQNQNKDIELWLNIQNAMIANDIILDIGI